MACKHKLLGHLFSGRLAEELQGRGWNAQNLQQLPKADPEKLKIAARLRAETTVTLKWIAHHLNMGAPGYLSDCLRTARL